MEVVVTGTGGAAGWPEPGCRCASCERAARADPRVPSAILIDGRLYLAAAGGAPVSIAQSTRSSGLDCAIDTLRPGAGTDAGAGQDAGGGRGAVVDGYLVREIRGGWDVTGPDGMRLVYPSGPGAVLVPPADAGPYNIAFVDLLGDPFQLGRLRNVGVVTERTVTVAAFADHRVWSVAELERRCGFWQAGLIRDGEAVRYPRYAAIEARRVLVLGGARSGKSERAELRVAAEPTVSYVATGADGTGDAEWAARIARHRERRPGWWRTIETTDLAGVLGVKRDGVLLVDGLGTWLAAVLGDAERRVPELIEAWRQTPNRVVAVSDEAGLGVVPATEAGRTFRDWLGLLNRALAAESEQAEFVVAGRVVSLSG